MSPYHDGIFQLAFDLLALPFNALGYAARWICFEILLGWNLRAEHETH